MAGGVRLERVRRRVSCEMGVSYGDWMVKNPCALEIADKHEAGKKIRRLLCCKELSSCGCRRVQAEQDCHPELLLLDESSSNIASPYGGHLLCD